MKLAPCPSPLAPCPLPLATRRWQLALLALLGATASQAQAVRDEQFYYPGSFNWVFRKEYPGVARLFNAFDYGHAILYETLVTKPDQAAERLEVREFTFLTTDLLRRPPRFAVAEEVVQPAYSRLAWRAKQIFDWAHMLHRQIYDVYADERIPAERKAELAERLTAYYLSNRRYAFADRPKAMELMDDQYYSKVFRKEYPKFNGLIWAYHWLQVGLYEALIDEPSRPDRHAAVEETIERFWAMLADPPSRMPKVMPMTAAVAPHFAERHPRAAMIFDNLHMLHDIISDVLASPKVAKSDKMRVIEAALDEFQDGSKNVMELEHWRMMAEHMGGVELMGGVAGRRDR